MTLMTMLEVIKQQFPDKMEAQIRMDLNNAYCLYSEETRLPFENIDVTVRSGVLSVDGPTVIEDTVDGPVAVMTPIVLVRTRGWYALPERVNNVIVVTGFDARNNEVSILDFHVENIGRTFGILTLNNFVYEKDGLPSGIAMLRFGCSVTPMAGQWRMMKW